MDDNPYQSPEPPSDTVVDVDYYSLPMTVPRRGRLDRAYPILLATWAIGMAFLHGFFLSLVGLIFSLYFLILACTSIGIWRRNTIATVIAIVQLVILWIFEVASLGLAFVSIKRISGSDFTEYKLCFLLGFFAIQLILYLAPTSLFIFLAWRQRSR